MLGAIFPVVPFFFLGGNAAVASSLALSAVALFGIGAITSIFTGRSAVRTGLRQVAVCVAAPAVTYGLSRLLVVSLSYAVFLSTYAPAPVAERMHTDRFT